MSISNQNKAYFFAATAIFFWSTVATAFKLSLEYLEPVQLVFYATIFSVLIRVTIVSHDQFFSLRHQFGHNI